MDSFVFGGSDVAVEAELQFGVTGTNHGSEVNPVAPDNGRGMSQARNGSGPDDVRFGFYVPFYRSHFLGREPARSGSAELRPLGAERADQEQRTEDLVDSVHGWQDDWFLATNVCKDGRQANQTLCRVCKTAPAGRSSRTGDIRIFTS